MQTWSGFKYVDIMSCVLCVCRVAGPPSVPASTSCLHQQSEEERGAAAGPEELHPPAAAAALPGARHGHMQHLHSLLPSAAASGQCPPLWL